ncbi:transposase [Patescibacteria group bacterium]|nr:transposase [Patescibacteria group bacterium]
MERKFQFEIDEYYHLYNRGTNKMLIFSDILDKERFIKLLFVCNNTKPVIFRTIQKKALDKIDSGETLVDIGLYCLMPNHFHLLVREKVENGISLFVEKIATAYSMYFNKKNERTGGLFEGTFKATHANEDNYLKYLFAYIHLNPVKLIDSDWKEKGISDIKKAKHFLEKYKYSSYLDYIDIKRPENLILNKSAFPEYFTNSQDFNDFIEDWLSYGDENQPIQNYPRTVLG